MLRKYFLLLFLTKTDFFYANISKLNVLRKKQYLATELMLHKYEPKRRIYSKYK